MDAQDTSILGKWDYSGLDLACFSDSAQESYRKSAAFLVDNVEDWGCGTGWSKKFFKNYRGIDGSQARNVDQVVDLSEYTSNVENILMREVLEYLFIAEHFNGDLTKQTPEDTSQRDPRRSAFYDAISHNRIKRFTLTGKGHLFTVDLTDGHFEIDGRTFYTKPPPAGAQLEVIYYRQIQQRLSVSKEKSKTLEPVTRYYIGWQCNHKGKNYKYELGVD